LAPDFGCATNPTLRPWDELPRQEKNSVIAAARLALLEVASTTPEQDDRRRYFAKPGESEWGC
jgi:hypothetical protein